MIFGVILHYKSAFLLQVRQKKYEVLDNKHHSLNGVVTITTVTNLHTSSEFNQNQVEVGSQYGIK